MILKYISIPELNFSSSWKIGWGKVQNLSKFDKFMTIFWFLGPFIYLIERSPADFWLTMIAIIFVIRCFIKKEWFWTSQLWIKLALGFWVFGLFSGLTSPDPWFSFTQGFVWIRFPLYAAAAQVWLAKDRDIRILMLLSILSGLIIMCFILISETIIEPKLRLIWPYGDTVPGSYISKFSLPIFCILIAIAVKKKSKIGLFSGLIGLIAIGVTILTGERGNVIIITCSAVLAGLVWKPKFILYSSLILIKIILIYFIISTRPDISHNFGTRLINNVQILNTSESNPYWGAWRGGIQQGFLEPIKGIGPSGTRKSCKDLNTDLPSWLPGKNYCGNHPHNFYIQLFAETGIIGLILGSFMFLSIISNCYKSRSQNLNCPMSSTAFIVPIAFFFPIQQFGSFYGQWGNLFIWFALAFAISQFQGWRKTKNN